MATLIDLQLQQTAMDPSNNNGYLNPAYVGSPNASTISIPGAYKNNEDGATTTTTVPTDSSKEPANSRKPSEATGEEVGGDAEGQGEGVKRAGWNNDIEFLMSCIALSVGLGNVWRFPFIALENGGGAFLIPYLIVLILVGKPVYYLEMLLGQFSSRGSVKVYDFVPIMRGECVAYNTQVAFNGILTAPQVLDMVRCWPRAL